YGVIFVLAISLYPYIYLFAKTAFKSEAKEAYEVAKIMKYSEFRFSRVALLSARPAIFSGALLVLMETLSDYGASAYLGVDTFSAGIFKLWYDLNDSY
ncbi:ABC transporter permease subunit, partial [Campylobacter jejuni]|nr:ABC transporter permease subunit [Campylobacter jejuni]